MTSTDTKRPRFVKFSSDEGRVIAPGLIRNIVYEAIDYDENLDGSLSSFFIDRGSNLGRVYCLLDECAHLDGGSWEEVGFVRAEPDSEKFATANIFLSLHRCSIRGCALI